MEEGILTHLEAWFARHVAPYKTKDHPWAEHLAGKEVHTARVRREIIAVGRGIGLAEDDLRIAEVIALFHDLGRFEQAIRHGTFVDERSLDHAALSVDVLRAHRVLDPIPEPDRDLIFRAIAYHNRRVLPDGESDRCLLFARLIRDADKLDIWRVVTDHYLAAGDDRNEALELGLPRTPGVSPEVCADLLDRRIVEIPHVRNLNDFKLLQMGWVFDLYFPPTRRAVAERGYLEILRDVLPRTDEIAHLYAFVRAYLDERIRDAEGGSEPCPIDERDAKS
ncbi:MAG: HD domain-containing protein [Planctomycetes bacterium]|nr:HD domain-containing protein [Planctomycetota bacterium]